MLKEGSNLWYRGFQCVVSDWVFFEPGIIKDPWPNELEIVYEDSIGKLRQHWVECHEVTRKSLEELMETDWVVTDKDYKEPYEQGQ